MRKSYYSPTPRKWRKIGDALLGISTMMLTVLPFATDSSLKIGVIIAIGTGIVGKFLTNFFSEK